MSLALLKQMKYREWCAFLTGGCPRLNFCPYLMKPVIEEMLNCKDLTEYNIEIILKLV